MSENDNQTSFAAWRTIIITAYMLTLETGAFLYGLRHGYDAFSAAALGSYCTAMTTGVGFVAFKALGEHLGSGSGIKGAVAALMTDAKPGS